jgi:hypothetical protein
LVMLTKSFPLVTAILKLAKRRVIAYHMIESTNWLTFVIFVDLCC